jgi:cytochrome c554/c'-like protein
MESQSTLDREKKLSPKLHTLLIVTAITGFSTYVISEHGVWQQFTYLFHTVFSIALSGLMFPYLWAHFRRTLGHRRPFMIFTGLASLIIFVVLFLSGFKIVLFGQTENTKWIYDAHILFSFIFSALIIVHLFFHFFLFPEKRKRSKQTVFISLGETKLSHLFLLSVCSIIIITVLSFIYSKNIIYYKTTPIIENYSYDYGEHPFRPSQTETHHQKFIDEREIAISDDCANCHASISEQWTSSVHKQAASDPTYVTNISLLAKNKGISATRYCEGCHAPVALLTGQLSEGGKHAGIAGTLANHEGVGCMGCHGLNKVVNLKGVASYEYKPKDDYLFAGRTNELLNSLRHFLIKIKPEHHKKDLARDVLAKPEICATCHTQFMDKDMNNWGWVKMQDEYSAWLDSPYSQQHDQVFSQSEIVRCHDCHMPLVNKPDPSANENNMIRSHRFPGANTMLPVVNNDDEQLKVTKDFLQSNKVRLTIEEPRRKDAIQTHQALDTTIRTESETPYFYYLGETAKIRVIISNTGVGHNFPGGTLDINEAWVEFTVTDATNQIVYQSGGVKPDNNVDESAHFYRSRPVDKNGQLVWKHDLFNRVGEAYKNVIPAGQSDIVEYDFEIPDWASNPLVVTATLNYRKLNTRYAKWAMKEKYQPLPIVMMARDTIVIPLFIKPKLGEAIKIN